MPSGEHSPRRTAWWALVSCALLLCGVTPTRAAPDIKQPLLVQARPQLSAAPTHAIFRVDKSENRNQVYYGAHVDPACRPHGASPIYAYWRMRERGPNITEHLLDHEQQAYGIAAQKVVARSTHGGSVRVQLRAWPDRPVEIELFRAADGCGARAVLDIQRTPSVLQSIYIDIGFLFSVNYALLRGHRLADNAAVQEKLHR